MRFGDLHQYIDGSWLRSSLLPHRSVPPHQLNRVRLYCAVPERTVVEDLPVYKRSNFATFPGSGGTKLQFSRAQWFDRGAIILGLGRVIVDNSHVEGCELEKFKWLGIGAYKLGCHGPA